MRKLRGAWRNDHIAVDRFAADSTPIFTGIASSPPITYGALRAFPATGRRKCPFSSRPASPASSSPWRLSRTAGEWHGKPRRQPREGFNQIPTSDSPYPNRSPRSAPRTPHLDEQDTRSRRAVPGGDTMPELRRNSPRLQQRTLRQMWKRGV
jgi:hypothetical protein